MGKNVDWIIHYILDNPGPYPYLCNAHTHGMEKYRHPDFQMVLNLPQEHICYLLNSCGRKRGKAGSRNTGGCWNP